MKNVCIKRRILSLLLSLFVVIGLAFGFSGIKKVKAVEDISYLEDFYKLTYHDGDLKLLFSADVLDYTNISKSDITTLQDQVKDTFKKVIKEVVQENYNYSTVSKRSVRKGHIVSLADAPYDQININLLIGILVGELKDVPTIEENFLYGEVYDKMIAYYIDNYLNKFMTANPTADEETALNEIKSSLLDAVQAKINVVYAMAGRPAPDATDKVQAIIDEVADTRGLGEKVTVELTDVTSMMDIITDAETITDVINELEVKDDVQEVITNASTEDIVEFLTTIDVETIVDVVNNT